MADSITTVHLASGTALRTTLSPHEWETRIESGTGSAWVPLEDGRTVLVRLRNIVSVEPPADWEPLRAPGDLGDDGGEALSPDSAI
ncbi:MAG: hypothetical protein AVDCRST_MAG77-6131 [uncultured Chloroflexi bacterium]|uniref:Uncharacterized protein n=1 Tax=uncultured Chloroflexota bacterium TaxID=166587 RepID=A0A6J4KK50_9CHLR|nr:MAG: hypothetical protein AVDCRST_MAG77-6131 [uncultured Chloroflexota bacterium]